MSFEGGADWLVRPEREQEERPEAMLDALKTPGRPNHSRRRRGRGLSLASDRQTRRTKGQSPRDSIFNQPCWKPFPVNAKNFGVTNVKTIKATVEDAKLPENAVDLAILTDVYHELSQPELVIA